MYPERCSASFTKIMEGTVASVPPRRKKTSSTRVFAVDTTNILFICGGAFAGLDKLIDSREKVVQLVLAQK